MKHLVARLLFSSLAIVLCAPVLACPPGSSLDRLLEHKGLVIGEVHGTVETPAFFQCIVERALLATKEPLTVSLELEPSALDSGSNFWAGQDGRASHAMWLLLQFLQNQQQLGKLSLHLQLKKPIFNSIEEAKAYDDHWERNRGLAIKELAERGRVIALMGNAHASRDPLKLEGVPQEFLMAGYFMGSDVTRVRIETLDDGDAWMCIGVGAPPAFTCGAHRVKSLKIPRATPGGIVKGDTYGYDLIYFLQERAYSASPPHVHTAASDERSSPR